jgi:protein O-mannosyl-transferase
MTLRKPYQMLLLCLIVLIFYYPTLTAQISLVDDQEMLNSLFKTDSISLISVFFPHVENGGYYRPFVILSYYFDKELWGLDVRSMHLDNIVMHLINVLVLFCIAQIVTRDRKDISNYLPLAAAALFALHPIATESVNWISGRTDLMAGNFILVAAVFLLLYKSSGLKRYLAATFFFILLGIFSKETSFGMILAGWFILTAGKDNDQAEQADKALEYSPKLPFRASGVPFLMIVFAVITIEVLYVGNYWFALVGCGIYYAALLHELRGQKAHSRNNLKKILLSAGCLISTVALYAILRKIVFNSDVGKIGQTLKLMMLDLGYSISLFIGAAGFYFKKFISPFPLNFYILEVDPLYDLVGILLLLICLRLLTSLKLCAAFFVAGFCMLLPALPFAFGTIAWTGYAERYIYISSAFWIVSAVIFIDAHPPRKTLAATIYIVAITAMISFFGWQTYARNVVWQKNVTLLEDTVNKTPNAKRLRDMYMYALYMAGNIDGAKQQYAIGNSLYSIKYDESADLIMAGILAGEGKMNESLSLYESVVMKTKSSSEGAIKRMVRHLEIMLTDEKDPVQRNILINKITDSDLKLGNLSANPMVYYNLGQKALAANDKKVALGYFIRANSAFAMDSPYKVFSAKLIDRLKRN